MALAMALAMANCICHHSQYIHYKLTGACDAQDLITGKTCECMEYREDDSKRQKAEPQSQQQQSTDSNEN